jgi:hypothetical protein
VESIVAAARRFSFGSAIIITELGMEVERTLLLKNFDAPMYDESPCIENGVRYSGSQ